MAHSLANQFVHNVVSILSKLGNEHNFQAGTLHLVTRLDSVIPLHGKQLSVNNEKNKLHRMMTGNSSLSSCNKEPCRLSTKFAKAMRCKVQGAHVT